MNVLVYAQRGGTDEYDAIGAWLEGVANGDASFGISTLALSGMIRVVTHPRIFEAPTPLVDALSFATDLRSRSNCMEVRPGRRHWTIFSRLCGATEVRGNAVPDAYFAALAIESGSEWITTDRGFARFQGLRCRHPLR